MNSSLAAILALTLLLLTAATGASAATTAGPSVRGSVQQVDVTGAKAGATLRLRTRAGRTVATTKAGSLGGAVFRNVTPGSGYTVRGSSGRASKAVTVLPDRSAPPSTASMKSSSPILPPML